MEGNHDYSGFENNSYAMNQFLEQNDDDFEISMLVPSEATSTPQAPRRSSLDTMSSTPQREHYQGCLKLSAENRINKYNAFNLQLIDFMITMLRRRDARMEDLQTAATLIEACARIYSFRVDAVHYDVLKVAEGLNKAVQTKRGRKDDDGTQDDCGNQDEGAVGAPAKTPNKKKRPRGAIATNPETLDGDFDAIDPIDPIIEELATITGDVTASNKLFNSILPVDDNTCSLKFRTDDQFLEPTNEAEDIDLSETITVPAKLMPAFRKTDHICKPFTGFSISNWDPENEDSDVQGRTSSLAEENRLNISVQALAFDVNADVEPIPQDEIHNVFEEPAGIEAEEVADAAIAQCITRASPAGPPLLTDMRPQGLPDTRLEYSYSAQIEGAWAGPSHWRLKNNVSAKPLSQVAGCPAGTQAKRGNDRKNRPIDFERACVEGFNVESYAPTPPAKIEVNLNTLNYGRKWNENKYKMPIDRGLDESHFRKLHLRPNVLLNRTTRPRAVETVTSDDNIIETDPSDGVENASEGNAAGTAAADVHEQMQFADLGDITDEEMPPPMEGNAAGTAAADVHEQMQFADLGDINDEDLLPPPSKEGNAAGAAAADYDVHEQMQVADTGVMADEDLLPQPSRVPKTFIPYEKRAKKVDMKELKQCTWGILTDESKDLEKEDVAPTTFFDMYRKLPNKLSTNMKEGLSVPLAFLSVLHLASEKGLILKQKDDLSDVEIVGLK